MRASRVCSEKASVCTLMLDYAFAWRLRRSSAISCSWARCGKILGVEKRIIRREGDGWAGTAVAGYTDGAPGTVERHTIVGERKDDPAQPGPALELRYFRLAAGAASRLERHQHEHYVIVGEGRGHAYIDGRLAEVGPHDVIYVGALEAHQFVNAGEEPFGFFCVVTAARDISQPLTPAEIASIMASPAGAIVKPEGQPRPRH